MGLKGFDGPPVRVLPDALPVVRLLAKHVEAIIGEADAEFGPEAVRPVVVLQACKCNGPGLEPHPCPYAQEINNDDRECNCCDGCRHECLMDI